MILRLFFTQRVYDNETDGMMTQFPKNAQEDDKQLFLSMNGYFRELEKLFLLSNTNMQCPRSICFSLKSKVMLNFLEMHSNIQTNH
jgi:hypothetical protein